MNTVCFKLALGGRYWLLSLWLEGVVLHAKKQCINYLLDFGNPALARIWSFNVYFEIYFSLFRSPSCDSSRKEENEIRIYEDSASVLWDKWSSVLLYFDWSSGSQLAIPPPVVNYLAARLIIKTLKCKVGHFYQYSLFLCFLNPFLK